MKERIGNVVLDYEYYSGEDLYSDGPVEDELLRIAETYKEEEYNTVIAQTKSWPVLYHFSHVRQNIVNWLPISNEDEVLEIGSGCGAITQALAKKAKQVTCVELSKKRSMINAYRNQEYENIEIMVGNFQDIEKSFTKKYDYITLIGVFEYSAGYIGGDHPYGDMLTCIKKHLAPGGKLIIAIENRIGLKYWAGYTEDHVGTLFEGLEGYPNTEGIRTFTKLELEALLEEAGDLKGTFYYPYPDYKFPLVIYSDDYLPKTGELVINDNNYDRPRIRLFDESKVFDTLVENHLFTQFSNSFLVEVERREDKG